MTRPIRLLLLLLALAVPASVLAACGGDDGGGDDSVAGVLSETFGADKPIKSGRLNIGLDLDLKGVAGLQGPVKLALRGPFSSNGGTKLPDFDFDLDVSVAGQSFTAGATSTGEKGFLTLQGTSFDIGAELYEQFRNGYEQAQKESGSDKSEEGPSFSSLGIKPLRWLRDAKSAGEEEVGGTETTHIAAAVDVRRFLDDISRLLDRAEGLELEGAGKVPGGLSEEQRDQITKSVKSTKVDVWSGKDDRTLRRIRLTVALDVPDDARKSVGGLQSGTIAFDLTISDLNEDQKIEAPKGARPLSELTAALQGGTAPQQGAASPGQATTPQAPAGGGANAPKEYLDCLNDAGQDIAKLQGCAKFLK